MAEEYFYCVKCGRNHLVIDCAGLKIQCQCGAVYECEETNHYSPTNNVIYSNVHKCKESK